MSIKNQDKYGIVGHWSQHSNKCCELLVPKINLWVPTPA